MQIALAFIAMIATAGVGLAGCGSDAVSPAIDAAPTIDIIFSNIGQVCGRSPADLDAGAHTCVTSLACCLSCADPGCTEKCASPCSPYVSGCVGGCMPP